MQDERLIIVTYDISSPRRWRRIFKTLHAYGEWIQLSVFQCRLSNRRKVELYGKLQDLVNNAEDHILFIDVGPANRTKIAIESIGKTVPTIERQTTVI
jgi:CRISPR-associated protein Cas2